jgi:hypothetical protein
MALLQDWALENELPLEPDLHLTVLYSRKPMDVECQTVEHLAQPLRVRELSGSIVIELEAPSIEARHEELMVQGGTHDYPDFIPHLTVIAKGEGFDPKSFETPGFGLIFGREYDEELSARD